MVLLVLQVVEVGRSVRSRCVLLDFLLLATCHLSLVTCHLSLATCYLLTCSDSQLQVRDGRKYTVGEVATFTQRDSTVTGCVVSNTPNAKQTAPFAATILLDTDLDSTGGAPEAASPRGGDGAASAAMASLAAERRSLGSSGSSGGGQALTSSASAPSPAPAPPVLTPVLTPVLGAFIYLSLFRLFAASFRFIPILCRHTASRSRSHPGARYAIRPSDTAAD